MDNTEAAAMAKQTAAPGTSVRPEHASGGPLATLASLAAYLCAAPTALITLYDPGWQWLQSRYGPDLAPHAPLGHTCGRQDGEVSVLTYPCLDNPHVAGRLDNVRFYECVPLISTKGTALGRLSVLDTTRRSLTDSQRIHLLNLAAHVVSHIELHVNAKHLTAQAETAGEALATLQERQRILDSVLEHTDVLIYAKDLDGRYILANSAVEYLSHSRGGLVGRTDHDLFGADVAKVYRRNDAHILTSRQRVVFSEVVTLADGSRHTYRSTKFPLVDNDGAVIGMGGISTDITELDAARTAHQEAEHRWRTLVEQAPIAMAEINNQGFVAYANPQACALFGASNRAEVNNRSALDFVTQADQRTARAMLKAALTGRTSATARRVTLQQLDGNQLIAEIRATKLSRRGVPSIQIELRDVTTAVAERAALEHVAATDYLTGTLNRRSWEARIPVLLHQAVTSCSRVVIALIDLDRFKDYNDYFGHSAGDALLRDFTRAARTTLGENDLFARWGGDEFILALPHIESEHIAEILERVRTCMPAAQTCSIGYTDWIPPETLADTISRADKALYRAKGLGRDQMAGAEPPGTVRLKE